MPLKHDLEENENVIFENAEDGSRIELMIRGRRLWVKAPQKYRVRFNTQTVGARHGRGTVGTDPRGVLVPKAL